MIIISYKIVEMRVLIEHGKDDDSWMVMIDDMLGKRPYVSTKFDNPDMALNFITNEFKNCSDFEISIK